MVKSALKCKGENIPTLTRVTYKEVLTKKKAKVKNKIKITGNYCAKNRQTIFTK